MIEYIFRNFYVLTIAIYSYYKLLNLTPNNRCTQFSLLLSSITTSTFSALLFKNMLSLNWIFILFVFYVIMNFYTKFHTSILSVTILFSYVLSFTSFSLSGIIAAYMLLPFYYNKYEIPWLAIRILGGIVAFLLIYSCFRIPRLQKGMTFLYNIPSSNIASVGCLILIILLILFSHSESYTETFILSFSFVVFAAGFLLIYWWNYHLTQTYRKFLRKNELDSLTLLLEEKNQEILYLKSENDKLARIIHKDNKIIPALSMAVINSYENKTELDLSELETDSSLYMKLKQLYDERTEMLEKYQQEILHLPQTAFDSVNAVLSYMQSEALKAGIPYQVVLFDNLDSTIPNEIGEDDFTHILSDLLANALNACKGIPSASIQIYLGRMEEISTIRICNTGNVFNMETLKNLGLAKHTTHADTGGSGIGLMDIWMLKQRYAATLLIDESIGTDASSAYTSINILFNHKNHYIIQSDRHKELGTYINRPDIIIITKE